jgi:hypothetical protein
MSVVFSNPGTTSIVANVTNSTTGMDFITWVVTYSQLMLANWNFNSGSGTWVNDTSGFNNNGTVSGTGWTSDAVNGTAYNLSSSTITIPNSPDLQISHEKSWTGWIKNLDDGSVITKGDEYLFYINEIGENVFIIKNTLGGIYIQTTVSVIPKNTWIFLAISYHDGMFMNASFNNIYKNSYTTFSGTVANVSSSPLEFGSANIIDEFNMYNYALTDSEITALYQEFQPVPAYPTGGMILYTTYPPLTKTVNFSWHDTEYSADELIVAEDSDFNLIIVDTYTSNDYYSTELQYGKTYFWKVKQYNSATGLFGDTSSVETFSIVSTTVSSNITSVQGTVYKLKDGIQIPISGATVYIRNEFLNWSDTRTTGANGYYFFNNLTNNTAYSISAKATGYEDSTPEYVTTIPGQTITKNIILSECISGFNCFYNQQYVTFKVQNLFGTKYSGVAVSVYKETEQTATESGTTGTDGSVTFLLVKDQHYRITFIDTSQGINREITIIPIKTEYIIIITILDEDWDKYDTSIKDVIFMNVSKTIIDDNTAVIMVSYTDLLGQTNSLTVYLNQTNVSDPYNQTNVQSWTTSGNGTHNFSISPYSGNQYLVHFKALHNTYGILEKTYSVFFEKVAGFTGIPSVALMWFAVICLVITAAVFTTSTVEFGSIIICGEAWMFFMLGFFASMNAAQIGTALTLASVLSVLSYISMKSKQEGYS